MARSALGETDLEALGRFIRDQRKRLGLTQAQLAERIGWVQERVSVVENGKYGLPSLPALVRLAGALETSLHSVLEAAGYAGTPPESAPGDAPAQGNMALQYTLQRLLEIDAMDLNEALAEASDLMAEAMGADKVDAFIYDSATQSLVALGTSNTPMGRLQHETGLERVPLANRGRTVEAYETEQIFCTGHADEDPGISIGIVETLGVRSMLLVPLRVGDEVQGVLSAASEQCDRFSEEEQRFFAAAARWVGMVARRAEMTEAMRQAATQEARRASADEIITTLAHDLGNYLTPLKGRIDMMRRRLDREGRQRDVKDLTEASHAVANIQQMVSRLMDVARLDQGLFSLSLQPVDLASLTAQVAADMRASWEAIETHLPDDLEVEADPVRMREVLVNLVANAIQHSPAGAPIVLRASAEQRQDGPWAVVCVQDQGPGIEPELLPRLFDRFTSGSRSEGLGLGLFLSRSIAEAHGGTLEVESSLGKGTTFRISLRCRAGA